MFDGFKRSHNFKNRPTNLQNINMISYNLKTSALLAAIIFVSPSSVSFASARLCGGGTKHTKQGIERKLNLSSPNHRHDVQNRIVGGVDATGREFSFMVNWEEQCGKYNKLQCE